MADKHMPPSSSGNKNKKDHLPQNFAHMPNDLITSENLSLEFLMSVFEAAFMDAKMEGEDTIVVSEEINVRVSINESPRDRIRFFSVFGFEESSTMEQRLDGVNRINNDYILICASVSDNLLFFRYDLHLPDGITKKYLVKTLKRFADIPRGAIADYCNEIVE